MMRAAVLVVMLAGGLAGGLAGCMPDEPVPLDLELELEPDLVVARRYEDRRWAQAKLERESERTRERVDEAEALRGCPHHATRELGVALHAGPIFDRIAAVVPLADWVQLVEPSVSLPGVRAYQVLTGTGTCSRGYSIRRCLVSTHDVHCGDRWDANALASFIETQGLADRPEALSPADWVRLVAVFGEYVPVTSVPELQHCVDAMDADRIPPPGSIEVSAGHASLSIPVRFGPYAGKRDFLTVEVEIDDGRAWIEYRYSPQLGVTPQDVAHNRALRDGLYEAEP